MLIMRHQTKLLVTFSFLRSAAAIPANWIEQIDDVGGREKNPQQAAFLDRSWANKFGH